MVSLNSYKKNSCQTRVSYAEKIAFKTEGKKKDVSRQTEAGRVWLERSHTRGNTERFFWQKDELRREVSRAREVPRTVTQEIYRQIEGNVESVE